MGLIAASTILLSVTAAAMPVPAVTFDDDTAAESVNPVEQAVDRVTRDGPAGLRAVLEELGASAGALVDLDAETSLHVDYSSIELDGDADDEFLFVITDANRTDWIILVVEQAGNALASFGSVDVYNQRGESPDVRVETTDEGDRWMVVTSLAASGTGFERYEDSWYVTSGGALVSQLQYPVAGHVTGHDIAFDRSFHSTLLSVAPRDNGIVVEVEFSAEYTNGEAVTIENLDTLFTRTGSVRYVRDDADGAFVHDDAASDLSEAEIIGLFADDEEGFLQHNFAALKDLASNGSEPQQSWLRAFTDRLAPSSERTLLRTMLGMDDDTQASLGG